MSLLTRSVREQNAVLGLIHMSRGESTVSQGHGFQPIFHRSNRKNKKYAVYTPKGKLINFGELGAQHYKDTAIGLYSHLDHNDPERRRLYRARHSKIMLKTGKPAYLDPEQAAFYSYRFLW